MLLPCSPPGTCTACYLADLCSEVARPGVVSAEKNLKHKVLLRSSRHALETVTSLFFFFNVSILLEFLTSGEKILLQELVSSHKFKPKHVHLPDSVPILSLF